MCMAITDEKRGDYGKLPSGEQALVNELTGMFGKHRDLQPATLARLINLAFSLSIRTIKTREAKLARAVLRGLEARGQLAETEGGSFSSDEVSRLLGISKTAVLKRLDAGHLLAWREERLQAARFPVWQFNDHGQVLPGLEEVLAILNQDERLDAWGKVLFFLQEKQSLGGRRPLDLLREGKLKEVCVAAHAYAE
jgi:hypothetical protein